MVESRILNIGFTPLEFFGIKYDIKPISRVILSSQHQTQIDLFLEECARQNIYAKIHYFQNYHGLGKNKVLYISKDTALLKEMVLAEQTENREHIGRLFGYPECCVRSIKKHALAGKEGKAIEWSIAENSEKPFPF
ncbi:MAG: hypothetical protein QXK06_04855 [Candidatus Diapherotrites archaeon]